MIHKNIKKSYLSLLVAVLAVALTAMGLIATLCTAQSDIVANAGTVEFGYTGGEQDYVVPQSGYYTIELWGASGGTPTYGNCVDARSGGLGGYVSAKVYLYAGTRLCIYVGQAGRTNVEAYKQGSFNGGGTTTENSSDICWGASGGGATDIRLVGGTWSDTTSLQSRILVAGGGGAGNARGDGYGCGNGGAGGNLTGGTGTAGYNTNNYPYSYSYGGGGTQTSGGIRYYCSYTHNTGAAHNVVSTETGGSFGCGGSDQSGGGGGWYGGACSGHGGAGGGSSYVNGYSGCDTTYYNSNFTFTDVTLTAGVRSGNGYAKITLTQADDTQTYNYVSQDAGRKVWTAPTSGYYKIELWGAEGGTANAKAGYGSYAGGKGGYTAGTVYISKDTIFYIYIGGKGGSGYSSGGYNGGGNGTDGPGWGASGGGATDIRVGGEEYSNRIIVAGGGGGGCNRGDGYGNGYGGAGGGINGGNSTSFDHTETTDTYSYNIGGGGGQYQGGIRYYYHYTNNVNYQSTVSGSFGVGGAEQCGGGGGWYGGACGSHGGGGGGSSYINGWDDCCGTYFNSSYIFIDGEMQQGVREGDGYMKITFVRTRDTSKDQTFGYTGGVQTYTVPVTGEYLVAALGAQGGNAYRNGNTSYSGGYGGLSWAKGYFIKGTVLNIYVGGAGGQQVAGGWNGGGSLTNGQQSYGASGGGATDIRVGGTALTDRIIVAGGGGGANCRGTPDDDNVYYGGGNGGVGGGLTGGSGASVGYNVGNHYSSHGYGSGGTQTTGGIAYDLNSNTDAVLGTTPMGTAAFGQGGGTQLGFTTQSGGGGGWYGGSYAGHGGGGGGSSYINGYTGCDTTYYKSDYQFNQSSMQQGARSGSGAVIIMLVQEDNTAPTAPTLTYTSKTLNYNDIGVSFSGSVDAGVGFSHYAYSINGGSYTNANSATVSASDGIQDVTITVRAYDKGGYYSESSKTFKFDKNNYTITYYVGENGTNNGSNPSTYNVETAEITLQNPSRAGFTFSGWYSDSGYASACSTVATQSQGNKSFYAKWTIVALGTPTKSDDISVTYTGSESTLTVTPSHDAVTKAFSYQWYKGSDAISGATGQSYNVKNVADSGKYKCKVTVTSDGQTSEATSGEMTVAIARATASIDISGVTLEYDYNGSLQTVNSGATLNHSETSLAYSNNTFTTVAEGNGLKVKIDAAETANYLAATAEVTLTVNRIDYDMSGVTFEDLSVEYDGAAHALVIGGTLPTGLDGEQVTVAYEGEATHVSEGAVLVTASFSGTDNYNAISSKTASITITAHGIAVTPSEFGKTYGEQDATVISEEIASGVGEEKITVVYTRESGENAGNYDLLTLSTENTDYSLTFAEGANGDKYVIDKADVTIAFTSAEGVVYGSSLSTSAITGTAVNASVSTMEVTGTFAWESGETVPAVADGDSTEYKVIFTPSDADNYNTPASIKGKLSVSKADINLTDISGSGLEYGDLLSASTISGSAKSAVTSGDVAGAFAWDDGTVYPTYENEGYAVTFTPEDTDNYNTASGTASLTVGKRALALSDDFTAKERYFDNTADVKFEVAVANIFNSEEIKVYVVMTLTSVNAGSYALTATQEYAEIEGDTKDNYQVSEFSREFTYTVKKIDITFLADLTDKDCKTYGDEDADDFCQSEDLGVTGYEEVRINYTRESGESVGFYKINGCSFEDADVYLNFNLALSETEVKYEIEKRIVTLCGIKATDRMYDGTQAIELDLTNASLENTAFTDLADGLVGYEEDGGTIASANASADAYEVTLGAITLTGIGKDNYELAEIEYDVFVTITPFEVEVEYAEYEGLVYNTAEQAIAVAYKAGTEFFGTDNPTIALTYKQGEEAKELKNAGDYMAYATLSDGNYKVKAVCESQAVSIARKDIASDVAITVNGGNGYTYSGNKAEPDGEDSEFTFAEETGEYGVDFTAQSYGDNTNVGDTSYVVFEGLGNYQGTLRVDFGIAKKGLEIVFGDYEGLVYNAKERSISVAFVDESEICSQNAVKDAVTIALDYGKDVTIKNATNYTATASLDNDNYEISNTATQDFTIAQKSVADEDVEVKGVSESYDYTGTAIEPEIAVVFTDAEDMTEVTDYVLTYGANVDCKDGGYVKIAGAGNYTGEKRIDFEIEKNTLTIVGVLAASRDYDGTTTVTLSGGELVGVQSADSAKVGFELGNGTLPSKNQNEDATAGYTVTTDITLTGDKAGNYTLTQPEYVTAYVRKIELKVLGVTAVSRQYDSGNKVVDLEYEGLSYEGAIDGDIVEAKADSLLKGTTDSDLKGKRSVTLAIVFEGADAQNYKPAQEDITVEITARAVTIDGVIATDREYDGTTTVALTGGELKNVCELDTEVSFTLNSASIASKDASDVAYAVTTAIALSGERSENYALTQPDDITVTIAKRKIDSFTISATDREYVRNDLKVEVTISEIQNLVDGESLTITATGLLATDAHAGENKAVTVRDHAIVSGEYASNYTLGSDIPTETEVNITPKHIGITGISAVNRGVSDSTEVELISAKSYEFKTPFVGDQIRISGEIKGYLAKAISDPMVHETETKIVGFSIPIDNADYVVDFALVDYEIKVMIYGSRIVTLDYAGGTLAEASTGTRYVPYGESLSESALPRDIYRRGYTQQSAWLSGDKEYDFDTKLYADVTIKATWLANTYKAYFNGVSGTELIGTATYDEAYTLRTTTKQNKLFMGWSVDGVKYTDSEGKSLGVWNFDEDTLFTAERKDMTINAPANATVTADNSYSVIYGDNSAFTAENETGFNASLAYYTKGGEQLTSSPKYVGEYVVKVTYTHVNNAEIKHVGVSYCTVEQRELGIENMGAPITKVYDDSDLLLTGLVNGRHYRFTNLVYGDVLALTYTAVYNDKNVAYATGVTVTYTGITGDAESCYKLESGTTSFPATITKAPTTITFVGSTEREYDGTIMQIKATASAKGNDKIAVKVKTLGDAVPRNIGTYSVEATISDDNYEITGASTYTFTIVPRALKVMVSEIYKRYDGTTSVVLSEYALDGVCDGDDVMMTDLVAEYATAECGSNIPVVITWELIGADIGNYTVSKETYSGSIHPVELVDANDTGEDGMKNVYIKVDGYIDADAKITVNKVEDKDTISGYSGEVKSSTGVNGNAVLVVETNINSTTTANLGYYVYLSGNELTEDSKVYVKVGDSIRLANYTVEGDYVVVNTEDNISAIIIYEPKTFNLNYLAIVAAVVVVVILIMFIAQRMKGGEYR